MKAVNVFRSAYGPWAVIAGASAGIGVAYAESLARRGLSLVLVARREKELSILAGNLAEKYSVKVRVLPTDLAAEDFMTDLIPKTSDLDTGLVIYNATFPAVGGFLSQTIEDHMKLIDINCRAQVRLIHHFGRSMKTRKRSGIILMSSLSAFQGTPLLSHYGASKAYTLVLGEGLARELGKSGIDLLVCCPGATRTDNFTNSLRENTNLSSIPVMEPSDVAEQALDSLGKRDIIIPGTMNKLASFVMRRILSRKKAVDVMKSSAEKLYGETR